MTMCTTQRVNIWQPTRETAAERTRERTRDSFSCLMSRAIMRPIYSHSPAFTGNGFQLQMTHSAFVHVMLTRTLLKWVWISSKSWLWKWGSKTAIWIVGFLLVVATYFYWDLLYISFEELRRMWVLHIHTRFQTFELLYTGHAHHNFSKCEIMRWLMWYLSVCWTAVVTLILSINVLCRWCLCGTRVDLQNIIIGT